MKFNKPRHPIVIVGAGVAGLSAAFALQQLDIPHLVLERFPRAGGRFTSRQGEGWLADHGAHFILRRDRRLAEIARLLGLDQSRVTIQGAIHRLSADGTIQVPDSGGIDPDRLCLENGFGALTERLASAVSVRYDTPVGAIRWDNDEKVFWWQKEGQVFWFEDEDGRPIRDEESQEPLIAGGVILATTATQASRIARRSRSLGALVPILDTVTYDQTFTGLFKVSRQAAPFYALEGNGEALIRWVGFEEKKSPGRIQPDLSLLVVDASPRWSTELLNLPEGDALDALYRQTRAIIPGLPEIPISRTYKRWTAARVSSAPLGLPPKVEGMVRWPVTPANAPFVLAGDYIHGSRAEDAARSGIEAAYIIASQIPRTRAFLGLRLPT